MRRRRYRREGGGVGDLTHLQPLGRLHGNRFEAGPLDKKTQGAGGDVETERLESKVAIGGKEDYFTDDAHWLI